MSLFDAPIVAKIVRANASSAQAVPMRTVAKPEATGTPGAVPPPRPMASASSVRKAAGVLLLALDPGTRETAFIIGDTRERKPLKTGKWENRRLLDSIAQGWNGFEDPTEMVIEMVGHYGTGMSVGKDVFETCIWIGRFHEAWRSRMSADPARLLRKTVCGHICGSGKAKDKNVRQAIIDRFGGEDKGIGGKRCKACSGKGVRGRHKVACDACNGTCWLHPPGPLCGMAGDVWQAMGVFLTYADGKCDSWDLSS